jgi:hypothetical protein
LATLTRKPADDSRKLFFSRNGLLGASNAASSDAHSISAMAGSVPNAFAQRARIGRKRRHANGRTVNADIMNNMRLAGPSGLHEPHPCLNHKAASTDQDW